MRPCLNTDEFIPHEAGSPFGWIEPEIAQYPKSYINDFCSRPRRALPDTVLTPWCMCINTVSFARNARAGCGCPCFKQTPVSIATCSLGHKAFPSGDKPHLRVVGVTLQE